MRRLLLKLRDYLQSELIGLEIEGNNISETHELYMGRLSENLGDGKKLNDVIAKLVALYPGRSIVAYGSRVRGSFDRTSDLDIIIIDSDRDRGPSQESHCINGMKADVTVASFTQLLRGIRSKSQNNNNWFLRALNEGIILRDSSRHARRLKMVANRVWEGGPPPVRPRRIKAIRTALLRLFQSAEKLTARSTSSIEAARLARMRCDQLVSQSIYSFYCVRGKWTSSFHKLVISAKSDFPELYALWNQYFTTRDQFAALDIARQIIDAVFEGTALESAATEALVAQEEYACSSS